MQRLTIGTSAVPLREVLIKIYPIDPSILCEFPEKAQRFESLRTEQRRVILLMVHKLIENWPERNIDCFLDEQSYGKFYFKEEKFINEVLADMIETQELM